MKRILSILLIALCTLGVQAQFGIRVNGTDVYPATHTDDFEGFSQYLAHIYVNAGDYCELYDINNAVAWTKPLNSASVSAFTLQNNRYVCSAAGCYDFYIKIKLNADELYIGPGTGCTNTPGGGGGGGTTPVTPTDYETAVPSQCEDIILQAFYWGSKQDNGYGATTWQALYGQVDEISSYFSLVWLPPSAQASGIDAGMGYIVDDYSAQQSGFGMKPFLQYLITGLHNKGVKVLADIVINHCGNYSNNCDFKTFNFGIYGSFSPNSTWITSDDEKGCNPGGNPDDGQHEPNYAAARDWDHKNVNVQNMCKAYLQWMKAEMKYDGWRYDYSGGYHTSHVNDYNTASKPYFSVMEYWYGDAAVLKQRIDDAGKNTLTFDFALKYNTLRDGIYQKNYSKCVNGGLRGRGYRKYAVTFIDNHDTFKRSDSEDVAGKKDGSSINDKSLMMRCNAYILSMPGVPCVFWPHWVKYKSDIQAMIHARRAAGIHSESQVQNESAANGGYKATIVGKRGNVILYLGNAANEAAPAGYKQAVKGTDYAMYYTGDDSQDIESILPSDVSNQKFVKDGQLYIRCGERVYDAQGKLVY